ncbi:MAG: 2-amino-4-hydroxy-6-hydroxymethyldihydropteridine diphosphokinase [Ignavibacteria bacterium]|nr:2-amino-4-hydroxy-6-hydroxymethyldihydropteridine diphosphokinase [Ignavibacteria bacterium]MBI3764902.1 2-amino-4-hydroxy-6-hydroxymethyldihydropteridine diphosphokinase [Ignavibacteriales bacterium]
MYTVYLGLGSNLGDRLSNLSRAVEEINGVASIIDVSSIYETEPVEMDSENLFYNMVLGISTPDDPPLLLVKLKKIEKKLGRKARTHLEPRLIDIDILLYRGLAYEDHTVRVPHPALEHRRFALQPLNEIAPTAVHPILEKTIASLLRACRDRHRVVRTEYHIHSSTSH